MFSNMCSVLPSAAGKADDPEAFTADAVLPPLSSEMIQAISSFPEARLLLDSDLIRLERPDDSSLRVTLTLNGAFPLRLVRIYRDDEIVTLFSQDIPTLAVWPSVPFPRGMWNAYFVYSHLPEGISVEILSGNNGSFESMTGSDSRYTAVLPDFPSAFAILSRAVTSSPTVQSSIILYRPRSFCAVNLFPQFPFPPFFRLCPVFSAMPRVFHLFPFRMGPF